MKKAIIIFSVGLSLIIMGSFITISELSKWNKTEETFEKSGYKVKETSTTIDISDYQDNSITTHAKFGRNMDFKFYSELGTRFVIDENQPEGSLEYKLKYYPEFGICEIDYANFSVDDEDFYEEEYENNHYRRHEIFHKDVYNGEEKIYLDLFSNCFKGSMYNLHFGEMFLNYDTFKDMMRLKKFPVNLQEVIITVNPKDESKLIK